MEQLDYIINKTTLFDMPYVKKDLKIQIKKAKKRKAKENNDCE